MQHSPQDARAPRPGKNHRDRHSQSNSEAYSLSVSSHLDRSPFFGFGRRAPCRLFAAGLPWRRNSGFPSQGAESGFCFPSSPRGYLARIDCNLQLSRGFQPGALLFRPLQGGADFLPSGGAATNEGFRSRSGPLSMRLTFHAARTTGRRLLDI